MTIEDWIYNGSNEPLFGLDRSEGINRNVSTEPMKTVEELEALLETVTRERDEARAEIAILTTALDERDLEAERSLEQYDSLMHQLADATNESTHFQVMCKRETEEVEHLARQVELLTDERDELLVRVANQDAELRATREAYRDAYRRLCAPIWEEP
jgi:chromosome segregation ATPase